MGIPDLLPPGPGLSISSSRTRRVAESGAPGGGLFGASAAGTDGPLLARLADEPPYRLAGPGLHYPERLRAAGIAGEVVVEVVVGVDGRPEPASARVIASTDRRFDAHALAVVVRSRYRPGRVAGRPVRVLVRHAVRFSLD